MARVVDTYHCEWKATLEDPEKLARFRTFVNSPEPDPSLVRVPQRAQHRPATWEEKSSISFRRRPNDRHRPASPTRAGGRTSARSRTSFPGPASARWWAGQQIAIVRTGDAVYALGNLDPFSKAFVLSRGIVGDKGGIPKIASPIFKQTFDLRTGQCLDRSGGARPHPRGPHRARARSSCTANRAPETTMEHETIATVATAARTKAGLLRARARGSTWSSRRWPAPTWAWGSCSSSPSARPLQAAGSGATRAVMGASFGVALTLVIFAGSELFTGNNLMMTVGVLSRTVTGGALARVWIASFAGNLARLAAARRSRPRARAS